MPGAGSLFLDIIPRIIGMGATVTRDAIPAAEKGGTQAGQTFGDAFAKGVTSQAGAATAAVEKSVRDSQLAVQTASVKVIEARNNEIGAADRVRVAEAKLAEARAKYAADSSQVVAAEARVEAARLRGEAASGRLAVAEVAQGNAEKDLVVKNDALAASSTRTAGSMDAMKASAIGFGGAMTALATVVIAGYGVKSAGDYQVALTKLVTTAGETKANIKAVGDGMLTMAGQVGISAQQLATGMYNVESAGFHGADALTVLKAAAQGAKQENADLSHVTDAVTTALHDYNLPAKDAATVTSQLITAVSHGKTTFDELTGAMHSVTPFAAAMHMPLSEVAGALSAMTASGESADQAAQNMAQAMRSLQSPTQPMIKSLGQLGITASDLSANLSKRGLAGTIQDVSQAILQHMGPAGTTLVSAFKESKTASADASAMMQKLPPDAMAVAKAVENGTMSFKEYRKTGGGLSVMHKALTDQWLTVYKNANGFSDALKAGGPAAQTYTAALRSTMGTAAGLNVALQLTGDHTDAVNASIRDIAKAAPQADGAIKGWAEVQGNFNQKMSETGASIKSWAIQLGQALLPAVTQVVSGVQAFVNLMSDHIEIVKDVGVAVFLVAGALGALALAQALATAATAAFNLVMDANPIVLVGIAIAALVAGAIYCYEHFQTFRDIINDVFHVVAATGTWLWQEVLAPAFDGIGKAVKWAWENVISPALTALTWYWKNVLQPELVFLWHNVFEPAFAGISFAVKAAWDVMKIAFDALIFYWKMVIAPAADFLWNWVFKPAFQGIGDLVRGTWNDFLKPVFDDLMSFFQDHLGPAVSKGVSAFTTAFDAIKQAASEPIKWVVDTVYTNGLEKLFNDIAKVVGSSTRMPDFPFNPVFGSAQKKATGGSVFGAGTGTSDDVPAWLSNGEHVWTANEVQQAGGHGAVEMLRSAAASGSLKGMLPGFATGGSVLSSIGSGLSSAASAVGGAVKGAIGDVTGLLSPFTDLLAKIAGGVGSSPLGQLTGDAVTSSIHTAVDWLKDKATSFFASSSSSGGDSGPYKGAVPTGGKVTRWAPLVTSTLGELGLSTSPDMVARILRQIQTESGGDPNAIQGNINDVNNRTGDLARGLMQVIGGTFRRWAGPYLSLGQYDPHASIYAGLNYASHKYGPNMSFLGQGHGYETGTLSAQRGLALVGERGPELVNFRGGEQVHNASDTLGLLSSKGGASLLVELRKLVELAEQGNGLTADGLSRVTSAVQAQPRAMQQLTRQGAR